MLQQFWKNLKNWIVTPPKNDYYSTKCGRVNNNDFGLKAATSVLVAKMVSPKVLGIYTVVNIIIVMLVLLVHSIADQLFLTIKLTEVITKTYIFKISLLI